MLVVLRAVFLSARFIRTIQLIIISVPNYPAYTYLYNKNDDIFTNNK